MNLARRKVMTAVPQSAVRQGKPRDLPHPYVGRIDAQVWAQGGTSGGKDVIFFPILTAARTGGDGRSKRKNCLLIIVSENLPCPSFVNPRVGVQPESMIDGWMNARSEIA